MIAVAAVFAGALVQGTTGFGFALLAAPLLVAVVGPHEAVGALLLLGIVLNTATLLSGSRPKPLRRATPRLAAWALPGLALGAVALAALPDRVLAAAVCASVLAGVVARSCARKGSDPVLAYEPHVTAGRWTLPVAGLSAGALSTSTGTNGPPLVLYLLHARATPVELRDTLATLFLLMSVAGTVLLLATGDLQLPGAMLALVVATLAGHEAGRRVFARLDPSRYERTVLALLTLTAAASGAAAVF